MRMSEKDAKSSAVFIVCIMGIVALIAFASGMAAG